MQTIELLFKKAQQNHGLALTEWQVRNIAGFIMQQDQMIGGLANMLAAYKNEYGTELETELLGSVEAEVIEDEQETETPGLDSEVVGLHSSEEE